MHRIPPSLAVAAVAASLCLSLLHAQEMSRTEPVEDLSPMRSRILLNGLWDFAATGEGEPAEVPAKIRVPGSWSANPTSPIASGVVAPELTQAICRRTVEIPASWGGRRITLDLRRVSTDAVVSVNGQACGVVNWPYGEVDITKAAKPGGSAQIEITVNARTPEGETWALMGYATEAKKKRTLASRGLIGDVLLESSPQGMRVTDVFVKPSVRSKALGLEVEIEDPQPGEWKFTARLLDETGKEEKTLQASAAVTASGTPTVELSLPWENPRLWDFNQPNLYTLVLEATPPGAGTPVDAFVQPFGFREFWIEGRDFYLNGTKFRLRPRGGHDVPSHPVAMRSFFEASRDAGFNISQIWPEDALEPGQWNFWELLAGEAGKAGWPLIGAAPSFKDLALNKAGDEPIWWANPGAREAWVETMRRELKRYRNFPAILIWGTTGNLNNHFADQDPRFLGQKEKLLGFPQWPQTEKLAKEALEEMRKVDGTRPLFVHAGGRLGDIFTVSQYLNLLPLQEREEMLSEYMQKGDVPYIGIEFGTPLNTTMNRGRAGFGPSHTSEPFATEYSAIYQGARAYETEPRAYRRNVRFGYTGSDWGGDWTQVQWLQSSGEPFQNLQALFVKNTWRSWRAAGVTGGMIPWNEQNQVFLIRDKSKKIPAPEPAPGQRGSRPEELSAMNVNFMKPEGGWTEMAAAKELREANAPVLAFIGGPVGTPDDPVAFTSKAHSFRTGQQVEKSIVLINDLRTTQPYDASWKVMLGGVEIASGRKAGEIAPAENSFLPVSFVAASSPPAAAVGIQQGEIVMEAKIGNQPLSDRFAFRVFSPAKSLALPSVLAFDPEGKTKLMLDGLGVKSVPWDGKPSKGLLVVGREALSNRHKLPASLAAFVQAGGRLLIFPQTPDFLCDAMGLRVAEHVSRRVFPVNSAHPLLAGLDQDDLRDWSAAGTLVTAKPDYNAAAYPTYGWHWGNRGSVSSAMVEKPHRSGWRPILEGEFDLAYTPLMELDSGAGRAILCTLDLEDSWKSDPAAELLARQLLAYAATAPIEPTRKTLFIGSDADFLFLTRDLGLIVEKAASLPVGGAALVVLGADVKLTTAQLEGYARNGGRVVVLAQKTAGQPGLGGGQLIPAKSFSGARKAAANPAARGLGLSDVRFRSDLDWTVFKESPETDAAGLLTFREVGRGRIVQSQLDPRWLETDKLPMFRITRWRQTRALAQVLANQGASFSADNRVLEPRPTRISLTGPWKVKIMTPLPNTPWDKPHPDPGMSAAAKAAVQPAFDDSTWETWDLPAWYPPLDTQNGEVVWRKQITIPPGWEGQILQLAVARVKAYDTTYLNGTEVGSTGANTTNAWNAPRRYRLPANLAKGGKAVIAIREFSPDQQGGIHGRPEEMFLRPISVGSKSEQLYHPDYKEDFDFGDNPYRYYRW